jgi:hypothetical protein
MVEFVFTLNAEVVEVHPVAVKVAVNVTVPVATPDTRPALFIVARDALLLVQVTPVEGDKVVVLPTQTAEAPPKTGAALTVMAVVVLLHPVEAWVNVNVAVPAAIPVTTPALVTVATAVLLLVHVPPVVGETVLVAPGHMDELPVMLTVGNTFTVIEPLVELQLVDVCVKLNVTEPEATPVITPALVIVAMDALLLVQVPPVVGKSVVVLPIQTEEAPVITGKAFMVTAAVVLLHPVEVCVKVYVAVPPVNPVTTPALVTVAMEILLLAHVPPVVGESVVEVPAQMDELPVTLTVGNAFTVSAVVVALHPVEVCV